MKEFEKKGNPPREPEGMKGLSKFLPMTDSAYRRRLTEYEIQIQDLQAHARALETETIHLRKKLEEVPDRKSTRLNSSHIQKSRMPSSA